MILNKKYLLLASVLSFTLLHATTIVLIRNDDGVFIGADSRIVNEFGESLGTECKVMRINNYYFTHAGLGIDSRFGFNIKEIAREAFTTDHTFEEQVEIFTLAVDRECSAYLGKIKTSRKNVYDRVTKGQVNIETAIAGVDMDGIPFFQVIKFTAAGSDDNVKISMPIRYNCPGDCDGGKVVAMLGQMSNTEKAIENRAYGMMRRPVKAINFLINREIDNSDKVGPPVTILKIGYDETKWIQHSAECENQ